MSALKNILKKIPGAKALADKLRASSSDGISEWLYQHEVCGWMYRPELRRQLPWPYRCFAHFAKMQSLLWNGPIVGGERALRMAMHRNSADHVALDTGKYTVFLNLRDPRMLTVPNELLTERPEVTIFKSSLGEGDTFLDVGANHGSFSIIASKLVGATGLIVAVEPQPNMAALVKQSLQANATGRFEVHSFACGDHNGEIEFFIPESSSGAAGVFAKFSATTAHRKLIVPLRKFDDAFDWHAFPGKVVLKLDVEGSELFFVRGAGEMLRARQPRILLEINPKSARAAGNSVESLIGALRELGYSKVTELTLPEQLRPLADMDVTRQRNVLLSA